MIGLVLLCGKRGRSGLICVLGMPARGMEAIAQVRMQNSSNAWPSRPHARVPSGYTTVSPYTKSEHKRG